MTVKQFLESVRRWVSLADGDTITYNSATQRFEPGPAAVGSVTIGDTQVAYATAANTLGGSENFTFDTNTNDLAVRYLRDIPGNNLVLRTLTPGDEIRVVGVDDNANGDGAGNIYFLAGSGHATSGNDGGAVTVTAGPALGVAAIGGRVILTSGVGGGGDGDIELNARMTGAVSIKSDAVIANGKAIKTTTTTAHTALLQAYDVNGTAYRTFVTLTNGDVPSCTISEPASGKLVVIPPTSDPGVAGALWNNAGTLALSMG